MRTENQIRDHLKTLEADFEEMQGEFRAITSSAAYPGLEDDKREVEQALRHLQSSIRALRWALDEEALS